MRDSNDKQMIRLGLFAGGLALGVVLGSTAEWPGWQAVISALKDWQDLIAGLLALLAAGIALRPVFGQLTEMRRQSAAASVSTSTTVVVALEDEGIRLQGLDRIVRDIANVLETIQQEGVERLAHHDYGGEITSLRTAVQTESDWLQRRVTRNPQGDLLPRSRACLSNKLRELANLTSEVSRIYFALAYDQLGYWEEPANPEQTFDLDAAMKRLSDAAVSIKTLRDNYLNQELNPRIEALWARIRALEEQTYSA